MCSNNENEGNKGLDKAILVIDPLSSPDYLVQRCSEHNVAVIALVTLPSKDGYFSYDNIQFAKILYSSKSVQQDVALIKAIDEYDIVHGVVGITACVPYAEQLLAQLFPHASNNPLTSQYRFDKFSMNEVLKENQLTHIAQHKLPLSLSVAEKVSRAQRFYEENNGQIVIKPSSGSAGSVGVFSPSSIDEVEQYFQRNSSGLFVDGDIVLQEKIQGPEYYIDAVSYQGIHRLVSIGRYVKDEVNGLFVYQSINTVDMYLQDTQALQRYALDCLEQLGVLNGFSHIEIIGSNAGFKLIEVNPRVSGIHGWCNLLAQRKYSRDQVATYLDLLAGGSLDTVNKPVKQQIFMFKNCKGAYQHVDMQDIVKLPSYVTHEILHPQMDQQQSENESLITLVMLILLESEDQSVIDHDAKVLLDIEQQGTCLQ